MSGEVELRVQKYHESWVLHKVADDDESEVTIGNLY